jgi:glycosyltransferase involved in cell wall biosynthesis
MKSELVVFTASFPYGLKETYLESEIIVLAQNFDSIKICPYYFNSKSDVPRTLPDNVIVSKPVIPRSFVLRVLLFTLGCWSNVSVPKLVREFFYFKVYLDKDKLVSWLLALIDSSVVNFFDDFSKLKDKQDCSFYFFWGTGWAYNLVGYPKNSSTKISVRLHGGDTYLERNNGYIPLRAEVFNTADLLLPISDHLKKYLIDKFNISENKIVVSKMGTVCGGLSPIPQDEEQIRIVSCSNVIKLKRLDLIILALSLVNHKNIEWIHFGGGPLMSEIVDLAKSVLGSNIKWEFKGQVTNSEIHKFYLENEIDAFVNVSAHEGVPVSIIEALSYGIPSVATNVGATAEVVNESTGVLIEETFTPQLVCSLILEVKSSVWVNKRKGALEHWENNYVANTNYTLLQSILKK